MKYYIDELEKNSDALNLVYKKSLKAQKFYKAMLRRIFLGAALGFIFALFFIVFQDGFLKEEPFWVISIFFIFSTTGLIFLFLCGINFIKFQPFEAKEKYALSHIDHLNKAIFILDKGGHVVFSNKTYRDLCGSRKKALLFEILGRDQRFAEGLYRLKIAASQSRAAREEFRIDSFDSIFSRLPTKTSILPQWVSISVQPTTSLSGDTLWDIEDITELHRHCQNFFQDLQIAVNHLDQAPAGFFAANTAQKIVFFNAAFAEMMHVDLSKALVTHSPPFQSSSSRLSLEDFLSKPAIVEIFDALNSSDGEKIQHLQLPFKRRNDKDLLVDLYFQPKKNFGREKDVVRFVAFASDNFIHSDSQNLQDENKEFYNYLESFPVAAAIIDDAGRIKEYNRKFDHLLSLQKHGFQEKRKSFSSSLFELIREQDRRLIEKKLRHAIEKGENVEPIDTLCAENANKYIRLFFSRLESKAISPFLKDFIIIGIETTEQKALEAQIDQNQKMQAVGQLAGGIAHDFNNVLTAIIMSCDLLLNSHRSSDPSHPDLINIKNNANRAASLVQQLLAFSRRQTLHPERIDITDLLSDIRMMVLRLIGPNIKLQIKHGYDLDKVEVDQASMQRVIMNLVLNARDAMLEGGVIDIITQNLNAIQIENLNYPGLIAGDYVEIKVCDNGTGIDPAIKERIFEPFFTTKDVGKGTGLGLSMVYGIIKQMGGYIYCDSELGKGTCFSIFLPGYKDEPVRGEGSTQTKKISLIEDKLTDLTGNATILIVEDEDAVRLGSIRALQSRGYKVLEAASGIEALEVLREIEGKVDLIVSDVVMPEMDGPSLLQEVHKIYPEISFIFVSGYAQDAFAKNLPENAQFHFLAKPFSLKTLASTVKEVLLKRQSI